MGSVLQPLPISQTLAVWTKSLSKRSFACWCYFLTLLIMLTKWLRQLLWALLEASHDLSWASLSSAQICRLIGFKCWLVKKTRSAIGKAGCGLTRISVLLKARQICLLNKESNSGCGGWCSSAMASVGHDLHFFPAEAIIMQVFPVILITLHWPCIVWYTNLVRLLANTLWPISDRPDLLSWGLIFYSASQLLTVMACLLEPSFWETKALQV